VARSSPSLATGWTTGRDWECLCVALASGASWSLSCSMPSLAVQHLCVLEVAAASFARAVVVLVCGCDGGLVVCGCGGGGVVCL
jgi:hypothetical protein